MTILHSIYQKTGMTPDEYYQKPRWIQAFMRQSTLIAATKKTSEEEGE